MRLLMTEVTLAVDRTLGPVTATAVCMVLACKLHDYLVPILGDIHSCH